MCSEDDDVACVVEGPDVGDVVASVLDDTAKGRVAGLRVIFGWHRLEGRAQVLCEEVESCANALPFFEGGGGCSVEVGL